MLLDKQAFLFIIYRRSLLMLKHMEFAIVLWNYAYVL